MPGAIGSEILAMARRLIVHVGPGKTGTSAIQHALLTAEDGPFCYPKIGLWPDGSHHRLVYAMFPEMARQRAEPLSVSEAMEQMRAYAASSDKDVLISSELLAGNRAAQFVDVLMRALGGLIGEVTLAMVARNHLERAASIYNQRVKDPVTGERRSPDEFLVANPKALTYRPLVMALKASGHRVVAINYHDEGDLVSRLVRALGGNPARLPPAKRRNISISTKPLAALLEVNRLRPAERARYFDALRHMRGFFASGAIPFRAAAAQYARPIFDTDADFLRQECGIELPRSDLGAATTGLVISAEEFAQIEGALSAGGINDRQLLAAIAAYIGS